ncbi:hypothetical protein D3C80_2015160 [compost metagenome]
MQQAGSRGAVVGETGVEQIALAVDFQHKAGVGNVNGVRRQALGSQRGLHLGQRRIAHKAFGQRPAPHAVAHRHHLGIADFLAKEARGIARVWRGRMRTA